MQAKQLQPQPASSSTNISAVEEKRDWLEDCVVRRARAAGEFDKHNGTDDGARTANSLAYGLTLLRKLMFVRIHEDVEEAFGMDSMLSPISEVRSELAAKAEIEVFQIAVSADETRQRSYLATAGDWYPTWLGQLRLGEAIHKKQWRKRLERYLSSAPEKGRLLFSNVLVRAFPEATRAPLVLFRLFPLAVRLVTATVFGDHFRAAELRNQQTSLLPAIGDCPDCHGRPLENGEHCKPCGNPLWNFRWLQSAD